MSVIKPAIQKKIQNSPKKFELTWAKIKRMCTMSKILATPNTQLPNKIVRQLFYFFPEFLKNFEQKFVRTII